MLNHLLALIFKRHEWKYFQTVFLVHHGVTFVHYGLLEISYWQYRFVKETFLKNVSRSGTNAGSGIYGNILFFFLIRDQRTGKCSVTNTKH